MRKHAIELDRVVFAFAERPGSEPDYLLLVKEAIVSDDQPIYSLPPQWKCIGSPSWEYALWPRIGERAGLCEVDCLSVGTELGDARHFSMEEYIALYRWIFKSPLDGAELFRRFKIEATVSSRGEAESQQSRRDYEKELLAKFLSERGLSYEADKPLTCLMPVPDFKSLCAARELSSYFPKDEEGSPLTTVELSFIEQSSMMRFQDAVRL